jgi:hypothetical protein
MSRGPPLRQPPPAQPNSNHPTSHTFGSAPIHCHGNTLPRPQVLARLANPALPAIHSDGLVESAAAASSSGGGAASSTTSGGGAAGSQGGSLAPTQAGELASPSSRHGYGGAAEGGCAAGAAARVCGDGHEAAAAEGAMGAVAVGASPQRRLVLKPLRSASHRCCLTAASALSRPGSLRHRAPQAACAYPGATSPLPRGSACGLRTSRWRAVATS